MEYGGKVWQGFLIWQIGEFAENRQIKNRQTLRYYVMRMRSVSVVAKFKTRQYVLKTDLPNLMLAKFSRYTVLYTEQTRKRALCLKWLYVVDSELSLEY